MANIRTVGATEKHHTTIGAALTWMQANHDFSTDEIATIQIEDSAEYNETLDLSGISGTPSSTAYLRLTVDSANRHSGVWGTGHARIHSTSSSAHTIEINLNYTIIDYLQIYQNGSGSSRECIRVSASNCVISRNILRTSATSQQDGVYLNGADNYIDHNVFQDIYRTGIHDQFNVTRTHYVDFNTFINCGIEDNANEADGGVGAKYSAVTITAYNNLSVDCMRTNAEGFAGSGTWAGDYNISSDQDADDNSAEGKFGATNNWGNVDAVTTSPASGENVWLNDLTADYDVGIADENAYTVTGNGTDRVGSEPDSRQDFSIDIVGTSRDGTTPDIGAFELAAAGGDITESPPNGTLTLTGGGNKQTMLMRHKIPPQGT